MSNSSHTDTAKDIREVLLEAIAHLEHVLPGQAPIKDFVHHNTLHGFQHLNFPEALTAARKVTGASGYLPHDQFREFYQQGRIDDSDLNAVLNDDETLASEEVIATHEDKADTTSLTRQDIYLTTLLHEFNVLAGSEMNWLIEEKNILSSFQQDVAQTQRDLLLARSKPDGLDSESAVIDDLWRACLHCLSLEHFILHPEDITDLSAGRAELMFTELAKGEEDDSHQLLMHRLVRKEGERQLFQQLERVGTEQTLGGFLKQITGEDILDDLRPVIIRHVGLFLDHGMAGWHHLDRDKGFYHAWREGAKHDLSWVLDDLRDWHDAIDSLADDPLETLILELRRIGLPRTRWADYLQRLALELPGWAGMFLWHSTHASDERKINMTDYLAVCLVMERLFAQRLCGRLWQLEARLDVLRWYFRKHRSEYIVRYILFNARLPEYLISRAQKLVQRQFSQSNDYTDWIDLADMIWTWRHSPAADRPVGYTVFRSAWKLFRMAQHLALPGRFVRELNRSQLDQIFSCMDLMQGEKGSYVWLQAYERHYREQVFNAIQQNIGRGRWRSRDRRPSAQITFCMDDREEGIRRHLEEIDPSVETLGAAGFFGVAINWRGLDDETDTPLCPIVVTPAHAVHECASPELENSMQQHQARRSLRLRIKNILHHEIRRNVLLGALGIAVAAPFTLFTLLGKILFPYQLGRFVESRRNSFDKEVETVVQINAQSDAPATTEHPRLGFTDTEQADRVENFLRSIGLVSGYAPLVIMMGHGSMSQNNPHLAAYDCGACSGRHGGPNARVFAAIANRPQVRRILEQRGLNIPQDTVFLGAEHNTCDEMIYWYDLNHLSSEQRQALHKLKSSLDMACQRSAHERSRRLMSASLKMNFKQALKHVVGRSYDFSQARPELGHATNAVAIIGRRAISQSAFFDRRSFLISYDPTTDANGKIIEAILLAAGPVGAGINLEYYFSTVNNEQYGCGTKVVHNVTGLFGVIEGASSDLRTGLPKQMIEIHEAMRLLVLVEASTNILTDIYTRQPVIQELVGNGWIQLAAIDPDDGRISCFVQGKGFISWQGQLASLPKVRQSTDYYRGKREPLSPILIDSEEESAGAAHA